jgi:phosphoribosylamine--glycine ligase
VKVLVIGSGAREHALVRGLLADPVVTAVVAAPGNPGMARDAQCDSLADVTDAAAVLALAARHTVDLVVVGPEAPLVAGVGDALRAAGYAVYGPDAAAARLEGSKAFAKDVMASAGVPTAWPTSARRSPRWLSPWTLSVRRMSSRTTGWPPARGSSSPTTGRRRWRTPRHAWSRPGGQVVVEEYLDGPEVSVFCICDGSTVRALSPAQDFKRVFDGDHGPNTGGMGAYSPLPWAPAHLADQVIEVIAQPVIDEMRRRGTPFVGTLYVGLAMTSRGPRVVEFNVRFGDPDGQVSLARLLTPLGGLLYAAATGRLEDMDDLHHRPEAAVVLVAASGLSRVVPIGRRHLGGARSLGRLRGLGGLGGRGCGGSRRGRAARRHRAGYRGPAGHRRGARAQRVGHRVRPRGGEGHGIPGVGGRELRRNAVPP